MDYRKSLVNGFIGTAIFIRLLGGIDYSHPY